MTENSNFNSENLNDCPEEQFSSGSEKQKAEVRPNYTVYIPYGFTPEKYSEYMKIKRAAKTVGTAFLAMLAISVLLSFGISVLSGIMSGLAGKAYYLFKNAAFIQVEQIIFSLTSFVLTFAVVFKLFGVRISDTVELKRPEKGLFLPFFLFGIGFCAFANIATSYAAGIFESFGIEYSVSYGENPDGFFGFALTVISTVIVPALGEEFACRGLALGVLKKFGEGFGITASAILFGLMHGNFEQMPFAFLVGLVLGFVTVKSGSLWTAVAIHAFNNFISVLFDYLPSGISQGMQSLMYIGFLCVSLLLGLIGLLTVKKENNSIFEFAPSNTVCCEKEKYKWFFRTAVIIVFAIICFTEAFAFFII